MDDRLRPEAFRLLNCTKIIVSILLVFSAGTLANTITYPGHARTDYLIKLLDHALSYHQGKGYRLVAFGADLPKHRAYELMAAKAGIDVVFGTGLKSRVDKHRAIHFPILKGLNGVRIPLVAKKNQDLFKSVVSESQLKQLVAGQFHTWSDTRIFRYNKLNLFAATNYEGLYPMLVKGRIDYFPRSIREIGWNYEQHAELDIAIDQHIVIQYPSAFYYFVQKGNVELANDIHAGLEMALEDGSFDQMFYAEHGELLKKYNLNKRRIFRLRNPLLSAETPLHRAELWINHPSGDNPFITPQEELDKNHAPSTSAPEQRAIAD